MPTVKLKRGTTRLQEFVLKAVNRPARLVDPTAAAVSLRLTLAADGVTSVTRACTVLEAVDPITGARTKAGHVAVAVAADPAMAVGVWRGRFFVAYPDLTNEYFPSDEDLDVVVEA